MSESRENDDGMSGERIRECASESAWEIWETCDLMRCRSVWQQHVNEVTPAVSGGAWYLAALLMVVVADSVFRQ